MTFSSGKILRGTCALLLIVLTACAAPKLITFAPWHEDIGEWVEQSYSRISFKAPKKLKRVEFPVVETVAFCVSAYTLDSRRFVPQQAVYIQLNSKLQSVEELLGLPWEVPIKYSNVEIPVNGYNYWMPASFGNADHSRKFSDNSKVGTVRWGYAFVTKGGTVCEVYILKRCDKKYNQINISELISSKEIELVRKFAESIRDK